MIARLGRMARASLEARPPLRHAAAPVAPAPRPGAPSAQRASAALAAPPSELSGSPPASSSSTPAAPPQRFYRQRRPPPERTVLLQATVACDAAEPLHVHDALQQLFPQRFASRSAAKRAVKGGEVEVGGRPAGPGCVVRGGDAVAVLQRAARPPAPRFPPSAPFPADAPRLRVLWQDDHLACVVKPQGIPMDSDPLSVRHQLYHCLPPSAAAGALRRPMYGHRLDECTGGLLLVAKTRPALVALGQAFYQRQVRKRYRAVVWGRLEGRGHVTYELDGRPCATEYQAARQSPIHLPSFPPAPPGGAARGAPPRAGPGAAPAAAGETAAARGPAGAAAADEAWVSVVDLWPHTGRTHQLRRHMALVGHPLLGDRRYTHGYGAQRRAATGVELEPGGHVRCGAGGSGGSDNAGGDGGPRPTGDGSAVAVPEARQGARDVTQAVVGAALERLAPPVCLWALELELAHPATGEPLRFEIEEPPTYAELLAALGGGA
eukprot:scaffold7.g3695.t1